MKRRRPVVVDTLTLSRSLDVGTLVSSAETGPMLVIERLTPNVVRVRPLTRWERIRLWFRGLLW